jgi:hypothetical protein
MRWAIDPVAADIQGRRGAPGFTGAGQLHQIDPSAVPYEELRSAPRMRYALLNITHSRTSIADEGMHKTLADIFTATREYGCPIVHISMRMTSRSWRASSLRRAFPS